MPAVLNVSPVTGPSAGGTAVTLRGANLGRVTQVRFGAVPAASLTRVSDTELRAITPPGAGAVSIRLDGEFFEGSFGAGTFTYDGPAPAAPKVSSISPATGPSVGGTAVTLRGANLGQVTQVRFGAVPAASLTRVSDTELRAVSPAGSGRVDVVAVNAAGASANTTADDFTYESVVVLPQLSSLSPSTGPARTLNAVTITGIGLNDVKAVTFGDQVASSWTAVSSTSIRATSPRLKAGRYDVRVRTSAGTSASLLYTVR